MDFLDELQNGILPGDGAMGTALMDAGAPLENCFEELCVSQPDLVRDIHAQYLAAGARVIETNSFGANAVRLARHGLEHRVSELNWSAAQFARDAAKGTGAYVAGSVGPLGITAREARGQGIDRRAAFSEQIGALLDGGVHLIFLETFLDLEEILLALEVKHSLHHCPVIASLARSDDGRLPDGTPLIEALARLRAADADVVGVNCVNGPAAMLRLIEKVPVEGLFSAFPNAGAPDYRGGRALYQATPGDFAKSAVALAQKGVRLIGGCCGAGPSHIAAMVEALKTLPPSGIPSNVSAATS